MWRPASIFACVLALICGRTYSQTLSDRLVQPTLLADTTAVVPGKPFRVALSLEIAPRWHVYWINPGDIGSPVMLKLTAPAGFTIGEVRYPAPQIMPEPGDAVIYGYERQAVFWATVTPPADLKTGQTVGLSAAANWCVCDPEQCVLGHRAMTLSLPVSADSAPANSALIAAWQARMPVMQKDALASVQSAAIAGNPGEITVAAQWKGSPPAKVQWLPYPSDQIIVRQVSEQTQGQSTTFVLSVEAVQGIAQTETDIRGLLDFDGTSGEPRGVIIQVPRQATSAGPTQH